MMLNTLKIKKRNEEIKMKKLKLTVDEDLMYSKLMGDFLNLNYCDLNAERLTIKELKKQFPRLRKLIKKNTKISLEVKE